MAKRKQARSAGGPSNINAFPDWSARSRHLAHSTKGEPREYALANEAAIREIVSGRGPDDTAPVPGAGAHVVANIPAAHMSSFVSQSLAGDSKPYKNGYDLGRYRVGEPPPGDHLKTREIVDRALPVNNPAEVYFCAVDLSGAGVRFYGDYCLVLQASKVPPGTIVLDRNSYNLMREPIFSRIAQVPHDAQLKKRKAVAAGWAGHLARDLPCMVVTRVFEGRDFGKRRLTAGQISTVVLDDEDYIEVLLDGSFGVNDLSEVRTAAPDAAADAAIGDRLRRGPLPPLEHMLWRRSRRRAERALRSARVPIRTVVTGGRVK